MYIGCFHMRLLCVMAITCLCIPLYVLIVAGHQGINWFSMWVSVL